MALQILLKTKIKEGELLLKLSVAAIIAPEKIRKYLLEWRPANDKSKFLNFAGYNIDNSEKLIYDIREQILPLGAEFLEKTKYGDIYKIQGKLIGPNEKILRIITIWMIESFSGETKFITLFPDKE